MAIGWKLHGDGRALAPGEVVAPDERLSWGKTVGLGAQHVVAMFGATFVFPLTMGLNPQLAIMMSGKTKVAPNMATTCCAPRPTVLPQLSLSSGATTSPGASALPSPWSFQPMAMRPPGGSVAWRRAASAGE